MATFVKYFLDGFSYQLSSFFSSFRSPGRSTMLNGIISSTMKWDIAFVISWARLLLLGYSRVRSMAAVSITCFVLSALSGVCFFFFNSLALVTAAYSFGWWFRKWLVKMDVLPPLARTDLRQSLHIAVSFSFSSSFDPQKIPDVGSHSFLCHKVAIRNEIGHSVRHFLISNHNYFLTNNCNFILRYHDIVKYSRYQNQCR